MHNVEVALAQLDAIRSQVDALTATLLLLREQHGAQAPAPQAKSAEEELRARIRTFGDTDPPTETL